MKKLTVLILCWATLFHITQAQDYKLTFALQGEVTDIDSVVVENATKNTSIKLNGNDTLVLTKMVNANQVFLANKPFHLKAYPNPSESFINIQFQTNQSEPVIVTVYNLRGSALASQKWNSHQGNHSFQIKNLSAGMYLVQVSSENYSERIKVISLQNNTGIPEIGAIRYEETTGKNLLTKSATSAQLLGYEEYDNIVVRVWPTLAPWELTRGFVMDAEETPLDENSEFVITYQKCEDSCGNVYNTVELGDQIWMAENFRCATKNSWVYNDDENNTEIYGRLYTWEDALNNAPEGWHLPSNEEWNKMQEYVQNTYDDNLPVVLKSKTGWLPDENQNPTNGTDASGFNMMPAGARWFLDGTFYAAGESAYFWTSTKYDTIRARMRKFTSSDTEVGENASKVGYGFSVRYIKDKPIEEGEVLVSGSLDESLLDIIDFGEMKISSVNDSSVFQADGSFNVNSHQFDNGEQPPILISKDDEAVFGFYPEHVSGNVITVDDIMYFFLNLSPDIRRLELTETEILQKAIVSSYYNISTDALLSAFQNNIFPSDDFEFIVALKDLIADIIQIQGTKSIQAGTYEFEFQRDGTIKWNKEVPTFASLALEIRKVEDNSLVTKPVILEQDEYIFSPTSAVEFGIDMALDKYILVNNTSYKFPDDGRYKIILCNNEDYIRDYNMSMWSTQSIMLFIPIPLFKTIEKGCKKCTKDCVESLTDYSESLLDLFVDEIDDNNTFSGSNCTAILKDIPAGILGVIKDCAGLGLSKYFQLFLDIFKKTDLLNYAETATNLSLMLRDAYFSDINAFQNRNFFDGVSFSDLIFYEFIRDTLVGEPQETFQYISKIDELAYIFDFQRGDMKTILEVRSTPEFASDLPFKFTKSYGDGEFDPKQINSSNGNIEATLKMGTTDTRIILSPDFINSGLVPDTLDLVVRKIPTFEFLGPYCQGDEIPPLPTTSINEITGIWSPEINNNETTTYTFMPNEGQNADTVTMEIVVSPLVDPTFNIQTSYPKDANIPALPTQSTNNISGTWQPELNNQVTTTYTFTPDIGQCANQTTITITIEENDEGTFTDSRDGKVYKTVTIGNQVWMAENLAYLPEIDSTKKNSFTEPYYYVYDYEGDDVSAAKSTTNFKTYGVLYNWVAANDDCPSGWHLPDANEWDQLKNSVNDDVKALAAKTGWLPSSYATTPGNDMESNNSSGFSALGGGYYSYSPMSGGIFSLINFAGSWWTSTEASGNNAKRRDIYYYGESIYSENGMKSFGYSVRCIKD
jgi:uncharacterized protein (TIGR02145 family)